MAVVSPEPESRTTLPETILACRDFELSVKPLATIVKLPFPPRHKEFMTSTKACLRKSGRWYDAKRLVHVARNL